MNACSLSKSQKFLLCLLLSGCLLSIISFGTRVAAEYRGGLPVDMLIFRKAAIDFWATGELYDRPEDVPVEKYHVHPYEPGAPIYKFPPAFQLALAPWLKKDSIKAKVLFSWLRSIMIFLYISSVFLMLQYFYKSCFCRGGLDTSVRRRLFAHYILLAIMGACTFYPFFNSYQALVAEIPLFFLFLLFFLWMEKWPVASGFLLAYCSLIKIYPAFFGGILIYKKNKRAIWASVFSATAIVSFCVYYFGFKENLFYLQEIFPSLLQEPVILENKNLSIESWLVFHGLREEITGTLFQVIRLLVLLYLGWQFYLLSNIRTNKATVFSLALSGLLLCLPNYWIQYQLFLLFPLFHLLATAIANNKKWLLAMVLICFVCLIPDLSWYGQLAKFSVSLQQQTVDELVKLVFEKGQAWFFWNFSKPAWVVYCLIEIRPFIPVLLLVLLGVYRKLLAFDSGKTPEIQVVNNAHV